MTTITDKKRSEQSTALASKRKHENESDFLVVPSEELFQGCNEIRIQHENREYRLRITRLNKLIMTV